MWLLQNNEGTNWLCHTLADTITVIGKNVNLQQTWTTKFIPVWQADTLDKMEKEREADRAARKFPEQLSR